MTGFYFAFDHKAKHIYILCFLFALHVHKDESRTNPLMKLVGPSSSILSVIKELKVKEVALLNLHLDQFFLNSKV